MRDLPVAVRKWERFKLCTATLLTLDGGSRKSPRRLPEEEEATLVLVDGTRALARGEEKSTKNSWSALLFEASSTFRLSGRLN